MTKGLQAPDAVSAARKWLAANKALFKLDSTDSLADATAQPFRGTTNDYAIVFKQVADGVVSSDGVATVALVGSKAGGWNVTYASSSLTGGSTDATGDVELAPAEAWTQAANDAGVDTSVLDIAAQSTKAGTTTLVVQGISQPSRSRRPCSRPRTTVPGPRTWRTYTNAGGDLQSYQVIVDAQTGDLLYRQSQVDYIADNPTWLAPRNTRPYNNLNAFPWNYPTTDNREVLLLAGDRRMHSGEGDNPATNTYPGGVASKQPWDVQATERVSPGRRTPPGATTSTTPACGATRKSSCAATGEPEGERNTEQADAGLGKGSGNDCGAATAQGQPEGANQLGHTFLCDLAAHEEVPP